MLKLRTVILSLMLFFIPYVILLGQNSNFQNKIIRKGNIYYLSNVIHIKLKHEPKAFQKRVEIGSLLDKKLAPYGVQNITQTFNANNTYLNRILTVDYNSAEDPIILCAKLKGLPDIEWAEPHYVHKIEFIPNDPQFPNQSNLPQIQAQNAWDISKGDTNVVIGIVDTGVDWTHPDLSANIWINRKEIPNNGIDDDHNGYIDDVRGWDFGGATGTPDNDPNEDAPAHGTHVAGIASAVTNNSVGIASIGFNCKVMAVKTSIGSDKDQNGEPFIVYGFQGIVYAADNGAKVINCSWGSVGGFSLFEQEVINYAVSKGALIVAAAGNENTSILEFPASYNNVISVASVNANDRRSSFSNYGFDIDVSAPGESILSTWKGGGYNILSGTSMATPLVSGLAGLVTSIFPNYTPLQVGEQVRVNADNIDKINQLGFTNLIGNGRINAFNALSNTNSKAVRAVRILFSDNNPGGNNNGNFENGEVVTVAANFFNYLNPIDNITITLESKDQYTTVLNPSFTVNNIATLDSFNNFSSLFQFRISNSTPDNTILKFLLTYSSGNYSDYQWMTVLANPTFKTQDGNNIALTLTSKGDLAFNDYPDDLEGEGFKFRGGQNLLFEGALMFGNSPNRVSDAARLGGNNGQSTDFHPVSNLIIKIPGDIASQQGFTSFSDSSAPLQTRFNILTEQLSYSFNTPADSNYIILRYRMINENPDQITHLYAGLFLDWDMVDGQGDIVNYNPDYSFGYAYHDTLNPNVMVGCALLSKGNFNFYGILNKGGDGGIEIYNDFTKAEKFTTLSSDLSKTKAGPGDISMVASGGPFNLNSHDTLNVAFVLAAGSNFEDLLRSIQASRIKYHSIDTSTNVNITPIAYKLNNNYPNPFNHSTIITYELPQKTHVQLKIYDILGNELSTLVNEEQEPDRYIIRYIPKLLSSGVYLYRLMTNDFTAVKKMIYLK